MYFVRGNVKDVCSIALYVGCLPCYFNAQVVLCEYLNGKMVIVDGDLYRALDELTEMGLISLDGRNVTVIDPKGLSSII